MSNSSPDSPKRAQVIDPVRRRRVALTPEEGVRQAVIGVLHEHYGYPLELMQVEGAISVNGLTRRCDIVVYNRQLRPVMIVECKRPDVKITQRVADQACRYNITLGVPYLMLTNGRKCLCLRVEAASKTLSPMPSIPSWEELDEKKNVKI
ncbi:MAG: type I restriction enzyme HsdR N-terminal domain-containing protein [Bacteroidales bacterium]|nr:type I restriction enzyme HsdR N-terminal domain-containing protein [Bacteroidales bacterium]